MECCSDGRFAATTMMSYETIIFVSWAAFLLVWGVSAFFVKRDVRGGGWQRFWMLRVAAAAIIRSEIGDSARHGIG